MRCFYVVWRRSSARHHALRHGPNGEQGNKDASVAAVVERDEERRIQGVDIADYIKGSLEDDASEAEEDDELDEAETVEEEARANQR